MVVVRSTCAPLGRWPVAVIAINSFGPDGWREPVVKLLWLSWTALCVALAHSARKALFDYAHGRSAWQKALEHPIGAGLAFLIGIAGSWPLLSAKPAQALRSL